MSIVYLNGKYVPLEQATISVMDRGFLFGDGVYEVLPITAGKIFRLEQHLNRLHRSLKAIDIEADTDQQRWLSIFQTLTAKNPSSSASRIIYLQITRGAGLTRAHNYPPGLQPTIFANISDYQPLNIEQITDGLSAITLPDMRWHNCYIKSINLLPNVLATQQAYNSNAKDAILIRDGYVIEAASSNVFMVKNNKILTPPLSHYMLPGITRDLILELAVQHGVACEETLITETELREADEIWLSGSVREIIPITRLDGRTISNGKIGAVCKKILHIYTEFKQNY